MREMIYAAALFLAVAAQGAVAPLFRLGSAEFSFVLVALVFVLLIDGHRAAMIAVPFAAVLLAFASGHSPALMIVAFMPAVLVAAWVEEVGPPISRYVQAAVTVVAAGAIMRAVLAIGAITGGADPGIWTLIAGVLVPGALLDATLLTVAYVPSRIVGWEPREGGLRASRYSI